MKTTHQDTEAADFKETEKIPHIASGKNNLKQASRQDS